MALTNEQVRNKLNIVRERDVDTPDETERWFDALIALIDWLVIRELKEPN